MNVLQTLVSVILIVVSAWLFLTTKTKRKKVQFIHTESEYLTWRVFKSNFWTTSKIYIQENNSIILIALILISILIVLGVYYFLGESYLVAIIALVLAAWGAMGASIYLGGNNSSTEEISSGTENISKIFKEAVKSIKTAFIKSKDESIIYSGYIELPDRIYVDESANIVINLFGKVLLNKLNREFMENSQNEELKLIDIHVQRKQNVSGFLKVELQAASLKIGGEANQQVDLVNNDIKFQWSISSNKPTFHKMALIFSKVSGSLIKNFGEIEHSVKVVNLFGLTRRQVIVSAGISGLLAFIPAILKILEVLGYMGKK